MKKLFGYIIFITVFTMCSSPKEDKITPGGISFEISYEKGETTSNPPIYVFWIENQESNFLQNIRICKKLIAGGLTGTALPYWKMNKYPLSDEKEIDAVTSATKRNKNFSVTAKLKDEKIKKFTVYCEIDRSFDKNDWFDNQPAILFSADINLDDSINEYELKPCGWTSNEITENIVPETPKGQLQREFRYITNFKKGTGFGDIDNNRSAAGMVKKITLVIKG